MHSALKGEIEMKKNLKNLKKNKKGFTLIEIIVVLVIMGILLAIAVPSVLGYVNKAREQEYLADARAAYLSAQTIAVTKKANGASDTEIAAAITSTAINTDLGTEAVAAGSDGAGGRAAKIQKAECSVSGGKITTCLFEIDGLNDKHVKVDANKVAETVKDKIPTSTTEEE